MLFTIFPSVGEAVFPAPDFAVRSAMYAMGCGAMCSTNTTKGTRCITLHKLSSLLDARCPCCVDIIWQHFPSFQMDPGIGVHFQPMCLFVGVESPKELYSDCFWSLLDRKSFATNEVLLLENIHFAIFSLSYSCIAHCSDSIGKRSFCWWKNINK